jgi:ABC-type branched-subunit amino acid transport system substrate-binding protein
MSDVTRRRTREKSMFRKSILAAAIGVTIVGAHARAEMPGVTSTEVKVGATFPFSGPASPLSNTGKGLIAYINSINERGGINGRKINLITTTMLTVRPRRLNRPGNLSRATKWPSCLAR